MSKWAISIDSKSSHNPTLDSPCRVIILHIDINTFRNLELASNINMFCHLVSTDLRSIEIQISQTETKSRWCCLLFQHVDRSSIVHKVTYFSSTVSKGVWNGAKTKIGKTWSAFYQIGPLPVLESRRKIIQYGSWSCFNIKARNWI